MACGECTIIRWQARRTTAYENTCPIELLLNRGIITNLRKSWGNCACLHYNRVMNLTPSSSFLAALATRFQALQQRIQQLPPAGARPLTVAGRVSGWVTARATLALAGLPGVAITPEAVHIHALAARGLPLNRVLETVAHTLKSAGCLRGWRNELLDVVGEGQVLGVIERAALRPLGLLTRAVHLNAWTPDGRLWVARRSATKTTDPGMLDTLVGGLSGAGESLDTALLRESYEEAGLAPEVLGGRTPVRVITRMHRHLPEGYQVEDALVSECVLDADVRPVNQDGEVSEIMALDIEDVWARILADEFTLEAELVVLDCLLARLRA